MKTKVKNTKLTTIVRRKSKFNDRHYKVEFIDMPKGLLGLLIDNYFLLSSELCKQKALEI